MEVLNSLISERLVVSLGLTIFHSLWQGAIIFFVVALVLLTLKNSAPEIRYNLLSFSISVLFVLFLVTFISEYSSHKIVENNLPSRVFVSPENVDENGMIILSVQNYESNTYDKLTNYVSRFSTLFSVNAQLISLFWFAGIIFFTLRATGGFIYSQRIKKKSIHKPHWMYLELFGNMIQKFGIQKKVSLFQSTTVNTPVLIGFFKPVILLPVGVITGMPLNQVETIIAHELAHVKRNDYIINIIQSMLEVLFFYHPVVWWLSNRMRIERELVCDDVVTETCGSHLVYSKALLSLGEYELSVHGTEMTLFKNKNELLGRINRIMKKEKQNSAGILKIWSILFIVILTGIFSLACSSVNDDYTYENPEPWQTVEEDSGLTTIRFVDENDNDWKIKLDKGEIISAYKNGRKLTKNSLEENKSFLQEEIQNAERELKYSKAEERRERHSKRHEKFAEREEAYDESYEGKSWKHSKFRHKIDLSGLHEAMSELKRNMGNLHVDIDHDDFDFCFDDMDIHVDLDDFSENMEKFGEAMGRIGADLSDCEVDMSDFEENMENFREEMEELGIDMGDLKKEMKKLKKYLLEVKDELLDDGYIEDIDDHVTLEYYDGELYIDDEKAPANIRDKYLNIHKAYYDKEPEDDWQLNL